MPLVTLPPKPPTSLPLDKATLYLDDIQTIFAILARFGAPTILADGRAADTVGDLAEFGRDWRIARRRRTSAGFGSEC